MERFLRPILRDKLFHYGNGIIMLTDNNSFIINHASGDENFSSGIINCMFGYIYMQPSNVFDIDIEARIKKFLDTIRKYIDYTEYLEKDLVCIFKVKRVSVAETHIKIFIYFQYLRFR